MGGIRNVPVRVNRPMMVLRVCDPPAANSDQGDTANKIYH
jgi:hypothetical protein